MLGTLLHHAVGHQAQDVGVVKEAVHLHLMHGSLAVLLVMAQDALQGVEAPVPQPLHQVHIAEAPAGSRSWWGWPALWCSARIRASCPTSTVSTQRRGQWAPGACTPLQENSSDMHIPPTLRATARHLKHRPSV